MFNGWLPRLRDLRTLPKSILQSPENPIQLDRVPKGRRGELEYPTHQHTAEEDRRHTLWLLALAPLIGVAAFFVEQIFQTFWIATYLFGLLTTLAMYVFAITLLGQKKSLWRWLVYFPLIPFAGFALCVFRDPYLFLGVGFLFSTILADKFATHYFHLKTTVPMARRRSRKLRRLWRRRFRLFAPAAGGVEFYKLAYLTPPLIFLALFAASRGKPPGLIAPNLLILFERASALLIVPLLAERAVTFFFEHPRVGAKTMLLAFRGACVQWFTYNRSDVTGPCVFSSPVGTYKQRRRLTIAAIVVLAAGFAQLFSMHRELAYEYDRYLQPGIKDHSPRTLKDKALDLQWLNDPFHRSPKKTPPTSFDGSGLNTPTAATLPVRYASQRIDPSDGPGDLPAQSMADNFPAQFRQPRRKTNIVHQRGRKDRLFRDKAPALSGGDAPPHVSRRAQGLSEQASCATGPAARRMRKPHRPQSPSMTRWTKRSFRIFSCSSAPCSDFLSSSFFQRPAQRRHRCFFSPAASPPQPGWSASTARNLARTTPSDCWHGNLGRSRQEHPGLPTKTEKNTSCSASNAYDDTPVIVPGRCSREHAHLLGDSGSGKTALGVGLAHCAVIRFHDCSWSSWTSKGTI